MHSIHRDFDGCLKHFASFSLQDVAQGVALDPTGFSWTAGASAEFSILSKTGLDLVAHFEQHLRRRNWLNA